MFLSRIHPGMTVGAIQKKVPWDLKISPDLTETDRPKDEEIDFIRHHFPTESVGKNLMWEIAMASYEKRVNGKTEETM